MFTDEKYQKLISHPSIQKHWFPGGGDFIQDTKTQKIYVLPTAGGLSEEQRKSFLWIPKLGDLKDLAMKILQCKDWTVLNREFSRWLESKYSWWDLISVFKREEEAWATWIIELSERGEAPTNPGEKK